MKKWRYRGEDHHDDDIKFAKIRKSRKDKKQTTSDESFEKPEDEWFSDEHPEYFAARVVEVHKRYAFISPEPKPGQIKTRDVRLATVVRKFLTSKREERNLIAVGDRVLCRPAGDGEADVQTDLPRCVILHMAPRHAKISRRDPHKNEMEHILAANMDQLMIVASYLSPPVRWGLIDRYLVLAEEQNIPVVLVLNKNDLLETDADEEFRQKCREEEAVYEKLGYRIIRLSALNVTAKSPEVAEIKEILKGKITIFSGHSGVGKSSLINLYRPEIVQEVEPDADIFYKGRHTTTYASFIKLGSGGYVIDTPGIRSFLLPPRDAMTLSHCFIEFRQLMESCRYRECRHLEEPECAVKDAVAEGSISARRYRSYVGLLLGDTGREGRTRDMDEEPDEPEEAEDE